MVSQPSTIASKEIMSCLHRYYPTASASEAKKYQVTQYVGNRIITRYAKVETTMIYTHVIKDLRNPVASPLDSR